MAADTFDVDISELNALAYGNPTAPMGGPNQLPQQSDVPAGGGFQTFRDLMGSIGTTARDVGTAVGTVRRELRAVEDTARGAAVQYQTAQRNANTGNKIGQWWQYATVGEKLALIVGVVGIGVAIWAASKD